MAILRKILVVLSLALSLYSCKTKAKTEPLPPVVDETISGKFSPPTEKVFDSTALARFVDSFPKLSVIAKDISAFYQGRNYSYAWFDESGMIEQAANLYNKIKDISEEGISKNKIPYHEKLGELMENQSGQFNDTTSLFTELMLTSQYLLYAKNVWQGIDEDQTIELQWLLPRKNISYTQMLDSLISGKDVLSNPPVYRQYYLLKGYLQKYRDAETADTVTIATPGGTIKKGDSSSAVAAARHKLFLLGDLSPYNPNNLFDDELELAVKKFQKRLGLKVTGVIKKPELEELNVPIHKRIEQILVNMERSRWVTKNPSPNHLIVNIPEYKLHAVENDSVVWNMNVVVGKNQHKTVVFNGDIKYVVFAPYWNIPASILKNETLPGIRRNKNYLAAHNMEWNNGGVRQKPGPNNALGLVKFLFPNSHSIYLHDSPAKSLFNETDRAFSHGCIRVAEPKKLAVYVLRNDTAWNEPKITAAMNAGKEKYVTLKQTVPVFIVYFTSWVSRDGQLNFRKDIYERDNRLLEMLIN
jgi:murein L,D-transpeptidase YcbB/YkuD